MRRDNDDDDDFDWSDISLTVVEHYDGHANPNKTGWQSIRCVHPDHSDRHTSARINLPKGCYYCNGCELSGSLTRIIQLIEGVSYECAVNTLENLAGQGGTKIQQRPMGRRQRGRVKYPSVLDEPWLDHGGTKLF